MPKTPTLAQVNKAMAAVSAALQDMTVPEDFEDTLNELSNTLQGIQDAIIEQTQQVLINTLAADNAELQALNQKINDLCNDLDQTTATIKTVATTVGTVASIIGGLV
ncbi:MAG TPA: hypothetical protein VGI43_15335 [Mucilaginibacter sp.]|jgi:archaellum component FlaC